MSSTDRPGRVRRLVASVAIDHRGKLDATVIVLGVLAYLAAARSRSFPGVLDAATRQSLYSSLATTSGALLGFALTSLAILVALPSTERLDALREHPQWHRVPRSFFRAAWPLFAVLAVCTLGITIDDGALPAKTYETIAAAVVVVALIRVAGALIALDQVMEVTRNTAPLRKTINDPGP